ncbi:MAG: TraR/DksA family transcriptional regulator [Pontibacterium sp.]
MSATLTASKVLAFRMEIERNLEQLRQEGRESLCDVRHLKLVSGAGKSCDHADEQGLGNDQALMCPGLTGADTPACRADEVRGCIDALNRISEGDYGVCLDCGEEVELNRLKANPIAARCIRCEALRSGLKRTG